MCCLPNKFPLPVTLLINKCDKIERANRRPWLEKIQVDNYVKENQFFDRFFISTEMNGEITRESKTSTASVDVESPLKAMIRTILQFKDIKEKLLNQNKNANMNNSKLKIKDSKNKDRKDSRDCKESKGGNKDNKERKESKENLENKESTDNSTSTNRTDHSIKYNKKDKSSDKNKNCSIL